MTTSTPYPPLLEILRREVPVLVWSMADVSLLVPIFLVLMPWARFWPVWQIWLLMMLLILLPFNLARTMSMWNIPLVAQRRIMGLGLVVTLIFSLRGLLYTPQSIFDLSWIVEVFDHITIAGYPYWLRDFGLIGLVLYTWWRGMTLPERSFSTDWIGLQFRVRALIFAPLVILLGGRRLISDITPYLALFGLTHLMMIAFARAEEVQQNETGLSFFLSPRWMLNIFGASALVVIASWFLASTAGAEAVAQGPQSGLLLMVYASFFSFVYLVAPIVFPVLEFITKWIVRLIEPLWELLAEFTTDSLAENPIPEFEPAPTQSAEGIIAQLTSYLPAIVFLLLLGGLIFFVIWWYRRIYRGESFDEIQEVINIDSHASPTDFQESLWDRLKNILPGLRDWRTARSIRRIYYKMVYAAEHRGVPRRPSQTPYEFLPDLQTIWPEGGAEVRLITNAYVRVRYGQIPEKSDELRKILHAWQRLESQLVQD